jgi:hypothetical protein
MTIPLITLLVILSQALIPLFKRLVLLFQMPYLFMQLFLLLCLPFAECALGEAVLELAFLYHLSADLSPVSDFGNVGVGIEVGEAGAEGGGAHDFGRRV